MPGRTHRFQSLGRFLTATHVGKPAHYSYASRHSQQTWRSCVICSSMVAIVNDRTIETSRVLLPYLTGVCPLYELPLSCPGRADGKRSEWFSESYLGFNSYHEAGLASRESRPACERVPIEGESASIC